MSKNIRYDHRKVETVDDQKPLRDSLEIIEDLAEDVEEAPETEPVRQPYMRRGRKQTDGTRQVLTKVDLMQLKHKEPDYVDELHQRTSIDDNVLDMDGQVSAVELIKTPVR